MKWIIIAVIGLWVIGFALNFSEIIDSIRNEPSTLGVHW